MILERDRGYTPSEILQISCSPEKEQLNRRDRQQLYEAEIVAKMFAALEVIDDAADNSSYSIFLTQKHEQIPDVRVEERHGEDVSKYDIEVVSFTKFSKREGLQKFLERTKLAPEYAYPDSTVLLCCIEIDIKNPEITAERISDYLSKTTVNHPVIMAFSDGEEFCYAAQVYPEHVNFRK